MAIVGALTLSIVMGRGGPSTCDKAVNLAHDIRVYDGSQALTSEATHQLRNDAHLLDDLARETTGAPSRALTALANDARHARDGQPFHAGSQLASHTTACS